MTSKTSGILSMVVAAMTATGCSSKQETTGSGGEGTTTTSSSSTGGMPGCGDGVIDGSEKCDDGNPSNGDGCSSSCQVEAGFDCKGTPSECTCTPGAFLGCNGASSVSCNASGDGTV